jgi:hypothetical protein
MSASQVHIAGVGIALSSRQDLSNGATEAGARALLDAGITYAKVQLSVACSLDEAQARIPQECFRAFGRQKAPICSMDSHSALHMLAQCVRTGQTDCAMLVGLDKVRYLQPSSLRCLYDQADRSNRELQTDLAIAQRYQSRYIQQRPMTTCGKRANVNQIATVAIVLVSDRFLVSHAFLKDSAVHVKACALTVAGQDARLSVDSALRQAGVEAGDIQLVEAQGSTPKADKNGLLRGTNIKQASGSLAPLKDLSTTGLASLCETGEFPSNQGIGENYADSTLHSLAAAWLDSRAEQPTAELLAAHLIARWPGCDDSAESLRRTVCAEVSRHPAPT